MSINQITKLCRVSEHTVRAVRDREAISISERKQRLMSIFGNIAELGAERMEELAPHATLPDAGMAAGIATDKLLVLLGKLVEACQYKSIYTQVSCSCCRNNTTSWWRAFATAAAAKQPCLTAKRFRNFPPRWICRAGKKICKNSRSRRILTASAGARDHRLPRRSVKVINFFGQIQTVHVRYSARFVQTARFTFPL
jgi:hypothetical protein